MDDKSKYEVSRSNRRTFVRPSINKNMQEQLLKPSIKHGGLRSFGGGKIAVSYRMEQTLTKGSYHKILQNHAVPSRQHMIEASFNLQQHPKHFHGQQENVLVGLKVQNSSLYWQSFSLGQIFMPFLSLFLKI